MAEEFRLQDPGEGLHEAEIVEIKVSPGDQVKDGDVVFTVETDKALMDLPAPFTGSVEEIRVEKDDVVEVGDVLLTYAPADEGHQAAGREKEDAREAAEEEKVDGEEEETEEEAEVQPREEATEEEGGAPGKEEAEEEAVQEEERAEGEKEGEEEKERAEAQEEEEKKEASREPVPASPATRRLARELEVDLRRVPGSGPEGRVTSQDVRQVAEEGAPEKAPEPDAAEGEEAVESEAEGTEPEAAAERAPEPPETRGLPFHTLVKDPPALPDFSRWGPVDREPLRRVRRSVARQMTVAWWEAPHVAHHEIVDITRLEAFRNEHQAAVREEGGELTLTVMVLKAAVAALKEHPRFNASLDVEAQEIVLKRYFNLGLAVDTPAGLVVPVIRNVDGKSLVELSREIPELVERTREGEATREDLSGGTFTLTNPGPLGGTSFTPLVRYPEVAILGMAKAHLDPVIQGDLEEWEVVPQLRLPLVLAFDHRVNDGADAARFMTTVVETLNDIDSFLLNA